MKDLEAPISARGFGTGWFSGFFALLLSVVALCFVVALRWPEWLAVPQLSLLRDWGGFRLVVHLSLLAAYALALLSLLLRPEKMLGFTALAISLFASLLGGSAVSSQSIGSGGIFFGVDFFAVNLLMTGLMFAPLERLFPHHASQRLFRPEWQEDLFYYLVSSMLVQIITFLTLVPSTFVNAHNSTFESVRQTISALPWAVQFLLAMLVTDIAQYWFHRLFHQIPFLWRFHAVHHSAKTMDWLAGARMHFVEIVLLRGLTSLPLLTLGFSPTVMQAYIGFVYVYSALVHANVGGNFNRLGQWVVVPRFHHWHHAREKEGINKNYAVHFPWLDRMFGTYYFPDDVWPKGYGVREAVPKGYLAQLKYPFRRTPAKS